MQFKIGGRDFVIVPGSFSLDDVIGEKSVAKMKVYTTLTGDVHFLCGTLVEIWDDDQTPAVKVFSGIVEQSDESHLTNRVTHSLTCADWHYLADKRVVSAVYDNTTAGAIVKDIIANVLSQEGVAGGDAEFLHNDDAKLATGTLDSTLQVSSGLKLKIAGTDKPATAFTNDADFYVFEEQAQYLRNSMARLKAGTAVYGGEPRRERINLLDNPNFAGAVGTAPASWTSDVQIVSETLDGCPINAGEMLCPANTGGSDIFEDLNSWVENTLLKHDTYYCFSGYIKGRDDIGQMRINYNSHGFCCELTSSSGWDSGSIVWAVQPTIVSTELRYFEFYAKTLPQGSTRTDSAKGKIYPYTWYIVNQPANPNEGVWVRWANMQIVEGKKAVPFTMEKALTIEEATTNVCLNPNCEKDTGNWTLWTPGGGEVLSRATDWGKYTGTSAKGTTNAAGDAMYLFSNFTQAFASGEVWTGSVDVITSTDCYINVGFKMAGNHKPATVLQMYAGVPRRVSVVWTADAAYASGGQLAIWGNTWAVGANAWFKVCGCQIEKKGWATTFADKAGRAVETFNVNDLSTRLGTSINNFTVAFRYKPWKPGNLIPTQAESPVLLQIGNYYANSSLSLWAFRTGVVGQEPNLTLFAKGQSNAGWSYNGETSGAVVWGGTHWYDDMSWHTYIVQVYNNGSRVRVFYDGTDGGEKMIADPITAWDGDFLSFGHTGGGTKGNGEFSDMILIDHATTTAENLSYRSGRLWEIEGVKWRSGGETKGNLINCDTAANSLVPLKYGSNRVKTWATQANFDASGVSKTNINTANARLELAGTVGTWHFTDFAFRKKFRMNNTSGGTATAYQVKLDIYANSGGNIGLANRCLAWPNDIRICNSSGTLLDYHRISSDANHAYIWVEFDSIPNGGADFYIYFGKSGATDVSNPANTWIYYYPADAITGWSPSTSGSAGYQMVSGELEAWSYTNSGSVENVTTSSTYPVSNSRHIFKLRWNNDPMGNRNDESVDSYFGLTGYIAAGKWCVRGYTYLYNGENSVWPYLNSTNLGSVYGIPSGSWSAADEWEVRASLTDIKMYRNGSQCGTTQAWGNYANNSLQLRSNGSGPNQWSVLRIRLDYLIIGKYMANEPTIGTVDAEEAMLPANTTGTWISEAYNIGSTSVSSGVTLSWTVGNGTAGTVSVYASLDNGATWTAALTSGQVIPGLEDGVDVGSITQVKVKVVIVNSQNGATPYVDDVVLTSNAKYIPSATWMSARQDIAAVRRVKTSAVSWNSTNTGGSMAIMASLDGRQWFTCTSGQPIPCLKAGMDLSTWHHLYFKVVFTNTNTGCYTLNDLTYSVTSGYEWEGTRTVELDLSPAGFCSDDSLFTCTYNCPAGTGIDTDSSLDNGGSWQDITAVDVAIPNLTQEFNCVGSKLLLRQKLVSFDGQDTPVITSVGVLVPCALIQDGVGVDHAVFPYEQATSVLNTLASSSGYWWMIDQDKRLHFKSPEYYQTAVIIDSTVVVPNSLSVKNRAQVYRNRQYVKGGKDITISQVETRAGDGKTKAYVMGYPLAEKPSLVRMKIGAGAWAEKTVGMLGSDTGKDWYYQKGSNVITQGDANSGTALTTADQVEVTYKGEYDLIVVMSDYGEIAETAAREGGDTTGIIEAVENNLNINSRDNAISYAGSVLQAKAKESRIITFKTMWGGIEAGMITLVKWPSIGAPFEALVQSVKYSIVGEQLVYDVTAVEGPDGGSWTEFFAAQSRGLTDKTIRINIGGSDILLTTANWSDAMTLQDSVTFQTFDCPIIGDSLSASNTTYPG